MVLPIIFQYHAWIVMNKNGRNIFSDSLAYSRKEAIAKFMMDSQINESWAQYRDKYGWRCVKVKLTGELLPTGDAFNMDKQFF